MILAHLTQIAAHQAALGMYLFQDSGQTVGFLPNGPLAQYGRRGENRRRSAFHYVYLVAGCDHRPRTLLQRGAQAVARVCPRVAGALKEGKLDEAVKVADRNKKSHLAEVVTAGLQEFRNYGSGGAITEEQIESSKRALERSEAIVHAKLKRGLGGLATIGSTAPFIGLFGTVVGILNAFQQIATQKTSGIGAVAGGISEALVTTAFGLLVAIPAVMTFNYFTGKVEAFDVEMDNSSSELIDYFIKQSHRR